MTEEKNFLDNLGNVNELLSRHKQAEELAPRQDTPKRLDMNG